MGKTNNRMEIFPRENKRSGQVSSQLIEGGSALLKMSSSDIHDVADDILSN